MTASISSPVDLADVRRRIDEALADLLDERSAHLTALGSDLTPVADALVEFCRGGKRIRPLFAYCGWRAARTHGDGNDSGNSNGDLPDDQSVIRAVASLELIQAAALLHDDIIDESDSRRGKPSIHRSFEQQHRSAQYAGDAAKYGVASAILMGDLALIWADAMVQSSGIDDAALLRVRRELDLMRIEVMAGQFLDVLEQARPAEPERAVASALRVAELKSASYTVARPMLIGAAIADASDDVRAAYATFGHHVGIAFQLRDDLLSVVGEEERTGKPIGGDVREGKRTALLARTHAAADAPGRALLEAVVGREDASASDVARVQQLMASTGAVASIAREITQLAAGARTALAGIPGLSAAGRAGLQMLADSATDLTDLDLSALPAED